MNCFVIFICILRVILESGLQQTTISTTTYQLDYLRELNDTTFYAKGTFLAKIGQVYIFYLRGIYVQILFVKKMVPH